MIEKRENMEHIYITVRLKYINTAIIVIIIIITILIIIIIIIIIRCKDGEHGELVSDSDRSDPSQA